MPKTIVCIAEEDMTMNYLFVKEMCSVEDSVLVVCQFKDIPIVKHFQGLFSELGDRFSMCALERDGHEDLWDTICRRVRSVVKQGSNYAVNLSGGTRIMSIAVQQVFERAKSKFYFMPLDRNVIIHSYIDDQNNNSDDEIMPIKHQLSIEEYLRINNINSRNRKPLKAWEQAKDIFTIFANNSLSNKSHDILDKLRDSRDKHLNISSIKGLDDFLKYLNFEPSEAQKLAPLEIQYLTGGWFEEYIYYLIRRSVEPVDIATGVLIQRNGSQSQNELDVVFMLNNRLFAIECKTGVGRLGLYNQIVYKACALKESLLGLRSNVYIFSLNEDPKDRLKQTARIMGIRYCDKSYAEDSNKLKSLIFNY